MSELSERMRVQRPDVPEVVVWADEVAALEARIVDLEFSEKEWQRNILKANARCERYEEAASQAAAQAFICLELGIVTLSEMRAIHDVLGEALALEEKGIN